MKPTDDVGLSSEDPLPDTEPPPSPLAGASTPDPGSVHAISRYSDTYAEWDDPSTIDAIEEALAAYGEIVRLEAHAAFPDRLKEAAPDIVFNVAEGWGNANRESVVPSLCEFWSIPYTGSDPLTLGLCLDKSRTKEVLGYHRVPTPPHLRVESMAGWSPGAFEPPLMVKPLHEGSSKGVTEESFCESWTEAADRVERITREYGQPAIVERFLPGREFTVAILGNRQTARALPIVELDFSSLPAGARPVYGFEAKWIWDRPDAPLSVFRCPARCGERLRTRIERVALSAYGVLGCRDWARIDVRCDESGEPHVIEVNPLPGVIPDPAANSCFPKAARAAGLSYGQMIGAVLEEALERYELYAAA